MKLYLYRRYEDETNHLIVTDNWRDYSKGYTRIGDIELTAALPDSLQIRVSPAFYDSTKHAVELRADDTEALPMPFFGLPKKILGTKIIDFGKRVTPKLAIAFLTEIKTWLEVMFPIVVDEPTPADVDDEPEVDDTPAAPAVACLATLIATFLNQLDGYEAKADDGAVAFEMCGKVFGFEIKRLDVGKDTVIPVRSAEAVAL